MQFMQERFERAMEWYFSSNTGKYGSSEINGIILIILYHMKRMLLNGFWYHGILRKFAIQLRT
eukprot:10880298-Karenia_brevis.AAC.1